MSGRRWLAAAQTGGMRYGLTLLILCSLAGFSSAERSAGATPRSTAEASVRHPPAVRERLREICESAGYGIKSYRQCAQSIARQCHRAGVAPESARCWQWLVDRDVRGELNRGILRGTVR